ncbi:hypothetical protein BZG36_02739 [Bifiguratus adelaidae]|uniref:Zn(2)-C6 fungal-type domain-containing protein n=1 Tax=Bifiguratus adelaidae TaxID=1938954 RepID=A0A261XYL1_9FUNG|nr:hypothetical protein BZG36_02739 [Bifiguratus adelaidae]
MAEKVSVLSPEVLRQARQHTPINKREKGTSCHRCRRAKIKCQGGEPCPRCKRKNLRCIYDHTLTNQFKPPFVKELLTRYDHMVAAILQRGTILSPFLVSEAFGILRKQTNTVIQRALAPSLAGNHVHAGLSHIDPSDIFPPLHVQQELISLFFRDRWILTPSVHKRIFLRRFNKGDHLVHEDFRALVLAVLAIGSKSLEDPELYWATMGPRHSGDIFMKHANSLIDTKCRQPTITTVQALLCMATYEDGAPRRFRSFMYASMACENVWQLKLNKAETFQAIKDDDYRLEAQMTFWDCFMKDTESANNLRKSYLISDDDHNVPLPEFTIDMSENPEEARAIAGFVAQIQFTRLAKATWKRPANTREMKLSIQGVNDLEANFSAWLASLPSSIQYRPPALLSCLDADLVEKAMSQDLAIDEVKVDPVVAWIHMSVYFLKLLLYESFSDLLKVVFVASPEHDFFESQLVAAAQNITHIAHQAAHHAPFWTSFTYVVVLRAAQVQLKQVAYAQSADAARIAMAWLSTTLVTLSTAVTLPQFTNKEQALELCSILLCAFVETTRWVSQRTGHTGFNPIRNPLSEPQNLFAQRNANTIFRELSSPMIEIAPIDPKLAGEEPADDKEMDELTRRLLAGMQNLATPVTAQNFYFAPDTSLKDAHSFSTLTRRFLRLHAFNMQLVGVEQDEEVSSPSTRLEKLKGLLSEQDIKGKMDISEICN